MSALREVAVDLLLAAWLISLLWCFGMIAWIGHVKQKFLPFARRQWDPAVKARVLTTMAREMERMDPNYWRRHWRDRLIAGAFQC